jgi:hypothetical protein
MNTTSKCLLSAVMGALFACVMVFAAQGRFGLIAVVQAQETKSSVGKTPGAQPQASANVKVDENNLTAHYANYMRVTATPEEVILDFALNPQPYATGEQQVKISDRLVLSFVTAKRLFVALQRTIEKHETTFGPIELDIRKRVIKPEGDGK